MVSDKKVEEEEEEEEDMEVAKIYNDAKDKHRKIMTGMYNVQCNACYSCRRRQRYSVLNIGSIRMNILMLDTCNEEQTNDVRMYIEEYLF